MNAAVDKLKGKFAGSVLAEQEHRGETTVTVKKEDIVAISAFLKNELGYNLLGDLCGVDYLGKSPRFMVVYHLFNVATKERLRLKVPVEEADATVDTVSCVWSTANWLERECYDLMGITFKSHPDLRRILMSDDWVGHPLRKDYPLQGAGRDPYQDRLS